MKKKVNILGQQYDIAFKNYEDDLDFESLSADGYCNWHKHEIVICRMKTWPSWKNTDLDEQTAHEKYALRHEITHAFFYESGLGHSAVTIDGSWATNEEMIDWWAFQGPKIHRAWQDAGALQTEREG